MASLNTSTNGPSISKSYQSIVNSPPPSGPAASSPTYGQWAVFSVTAPLANAFQPDAGGKESVLKVQSTGEGELLDLIDEFSDGRIQFAYVKVKDSNTGLPKTALIAWCGEGVPERTKGYFGSHLGTVAKLLHGYHVQITARSDRDLTPDGIVQKVADASGSKYSAGDAAPPVAAATKPSTASKPAFTPTASGTGVAGINRGLTSSQRNTNVDADGWGEDAPPVTRTQLEKVQPAYQPTRVDMRSLTSQKPASTSSNDTRESDSSRPDVVKGAYQPVGKVDIAAIRRQAQESGNTQDDRPQIVKGSYEPVGKVDIAAIRARAQKPSDAGTSAPTIPSADDSTDAQPEQPRSLAERSAAFSQPSRLTSLPKPRVANKFGGSSFTGTKAPLPGGFEAKPIATAAPVGTASKTFADEGGKTPAQIWAEKKARERGASGAADLSARPGFSPNTSEASGGEWKSGYAGKSWAPVETSRTGKSAGVDQPEDEEPQAQEEEEAPTSGGIGAIRDKFSGAPPMGQPAPAATFDRDAPEPDTSNKPNRGMPIPGMVAASSLPVPPPQPPRPDDEEEEEQEQEQTSSTPIRVAMPVARGKEAEVTDAREEQMSPPPVMPVRSLGREASMAEDEQPDDEPESGPDPARAAAQSTAAASMGHEAVASAPAPSAGGERAKAEYDHEAAAPDEVSLREGEIVTNIEKVDPDWWVVTNEAGETGLVPANYLSPLKDDEGAPAAHHAHQMAAATEAPATTEREDEETHHASAAGAGGSKGKVAIAQYDYEAVEPNELSFPEYATITNVTFPDEDWWFGEYDGKEGLFPANYVELQE